MGEHKLDNRERLKSALAERLAGELTDRGKLLEAGCAAMIKHFWPDGVSEQQRRDLRMAWFLGCDHLFFGAMGAMSEGTEITERDEARMAGIQDELDQFRMELGGESMPAPGRPQ